MIVIKSIFSVFKSFLFGCYMLQVKVVSPKHRLIKVDSQEFGRCKIPLSPVTVQEEPVCVVSIILVFFLFPILHLFLS